MAAIPQTLARYARAASDGVTGVATALLTNDAISILSDEAGRLWSRLFVNGAAVSNANPLPVYVASSSTPLTWSNPSALAATGVIKASAGELFILYGFCVYTTAKGYFQVFNKTTAPSAGNVPIESIPVTPATSLQDSTFSLGPLPAKDYATGISWGFSSTAATFTAIAGSNIWVNFGYL